VHVKQRRVVQVAAPSGVLQCDAVCAVVLDKDCPQPLLCAQLKEPLTLPSVPYEC